MSQNFFKFKIALNSLCPVWIRRSSKKKGCRKNISLLLINSKIKF